MPSKVRTKAFPLRHSQWPNFHDLRPNSYSGFEVTCPDCDLQSALDHAARDK